MAVVYTDKGKGKLWPMDFIVGPMIRYIFLSLFALLLLKACGGNDLDQLKKDKFCSECDLSGADLTGVNLRGAELRKADLSEANLKWPRLRCT